ncbi:MAG TPA: helix-turn-helix domain-containing protein [Rhizobiaceae bacterium]|nr:helix-turn-helix domain-containing protein [Rhizobiaceae bacterium]
MVLKFDDIAADERRVQILRGALQTFLAYGFQRTTMDDIARAAEISRPALYLHFRNKTDIYRALASQFLNETLSNSRAAAASSGPLPEVLGGMLGCVMGVMTEIEQSPHGADILDMKNSLAGDIVTQGRSEMVELLTEAIARRAPADVLEARGVTASLLANMLLDAIDGMKARMPRHQEQSACVSAYLSVIARMARGSCKGS